MGHLFLPAVAAIVRLDELQVIDDDQPDLVPQLEPAGVGGDPQHALAGRIVDIELGSAKLVPGGDQLVHFFGGLAIGAQLVAVNARLATQQALRQLNA